MTRSPAVILVLALSLVACAPGEAPATQTAPASALPTTTAAGSLPLGQTAAPAVTEPAGTEPAATGGGGGGGTAQSPFGRRDVPPGGVAAFLDFQSGPSSPCPGFSPPALYFDTAIVPTAVCVVDLVPGVAVQLLLQRPGGPSWRTERIASEFGEVEWFLDELPRPVEGAYFVQAVQDGLVLEETVVVDLAQLSAAFLPRDITRRQTGQLVVAGGESGGAVSAHLYREGIGPSGDAGWTYAADLGRVRLDPRGEGRLDIRARQRDELGLYQIVVDPTGADIRIKFEVTRRQSSEPSPAPTSDATPDVSPELTPDTASPDSSPDLTPDVSSPSP